MKKILLVEDDKLIVKAIKYLLEKAGYEVITTFSVAETLKVKEDFAMVILDINLPDGSGYEIAPYLKKPILFLSAREDEDDIVKGLEMGAFDYVTKPFKSKELLARINKIIGKNEVLIKGYVLNFDKKSLLKDNKEITLTSLEYNLLELLIMNKNKIVERDLILNTIWGFTDNFVSDNALSAVVKRLREKLGDKDIIQTHKGIGYSIYEK